MKISSSLIVVQESDVPFCFGTITCVIKNLWFANLPAKIPQVSILLTVFFVARLKNRSIRFFGMTTFLRRPSSSEFEGDGLRALSKAGFSSGNCRLVGNRFDRLGSVGKSLGYITWSKSGGGGAVGSGWFLLITTPWNLFASLSAYGRKMGNFK